MTLEQLLKVAVYRGDLLEIDAHFSQIGIVSPGGIIHLKAALITLANVADLEGALRRTYKEQPEPSSIIKPIEKNLEFSRYLRNKFVAHVNHRLMEKAVEWKPVLRDSPVKLEDPKYVVLVNIWVLETAINTYVEPDGVHKIFDTETDLAYPPDWARFAGFLETTIRCSLLYLSKLLSLWAPRVIPDKQSLSDFELAIKAGQTKFNFLKK